jgi:hypothetical protein
VGFTELTTKLSAIAIVNLLNDIFQRFDALDAMRTRNRALSLAKYRRAPPARRARPPEARRVPEVGLNGFAEVVASRAGSHP